MTIQSQSEFMANVLLEIYDEANWLYKEKVPGDTGIFLELMKKNNIYLSISKNIPTGFISYNVPDENVLIISGLYVSNAYQKNGIASKLLNTVLNFFSKSIVYVDVLKTAAWAISFYKKHDFILVEDFESLPSAHKKFLENNNWSTIMKRS